MAKCGVTGLKRAHVVTIDIDSTPRAGIPPCSSHVSVEVLRLQNGSSAMLRSGCTESSPRTTKVTNASRLSRKLREDLTKLSQTG